MDQALLSSVTILNERNTGQAAQILAELGIRFAIDLQILARSPDLAAELKIPK